MVNWNQLNQSHLIILTKSDSKSEPGHFSGDHSGSDIDPCSPNIRCSAEVRHVSDVSSPKSENNTDMKPDVQIKLDVPCDNDRGKKNEIIWTFSFRFQIILSPPNLKYFLSR